MPASAKSRRTRLAIGGLAFAVFAPLAYLMQRLIDHARFGSPDPLAMLRQVEVAFYWRSATACWWGGLATLVAMWLVGGRGDDAAHRAAWWLALGAAGGAASMLVLGWLYP
jgi:hypothetical protein